MKFVVTVLLFSNFLLWLPLIKNQRMNYFSIRTIIYDHRNNNSWRKESSSGNFSMKSRSRFISYSLVSKMKITFSFLVEVKVHFSKHVQREAWYWPTRLFLKSVIRSGSSLRKAIFVYKWTSRPCTYCAIEENLQIYGCHTCTLFEKTFFFQYFLGYFAKK